MVSRGAKIFCRTLHLVWAAGSQPRESNQEVRGIRGDGWTYPKFGISATNNTHRNLAIPGHWDLVSQANAYDEEKKQCKPQSCSAVIPSCGKVTALVGSRRGKPSFPRSERPMESIHSRKRNDKKICKMRQKKSDNKKRGKPHFPLWEHNPWKEPNMDKSDGSQNCWTYPRLGACRGSSNFKFIPIDLVT